MTEARAATRLGLTPSQTIGPFLHIALPWEDGEWVVPPDTMGAVRISGNLYDGAGAVVPDGLVETWQADSAGRFVHPDDPRGTAGPSPAGFRGFGRSATDKEGRWSVFTVVPGRLPLPDGSFEAPHLDVSVFARGLLDRVVTRIYFPDEPANQRDPVLGSVDPARRDTLIANREAGGMHFDIRLQGEHETVFFDL